MNEREPLLALRPATDDDAGFLALLYASTREDDPVLEAFGIDQRAAFMQQQFVAQSAHNAGHYADASFDLVLADGERAGRLIVLRGEGVIRIVDASLLPEWRSRGIGRRLLHPILAEGDAKRMPVVLSVMLGNPARRLYRRLGFVSVEDDGVYETMERPATP